MHEQAQDPVLHDPRFVAVGELVVRAADIASAEALIARDKADNSAMSGHATAAELNSAAEQAERDAATLRAMAACLDERATTDTPDDHTPVELTESPEQPKAKKTEGKDELEDDEAYDIGSRTLTYGERMLRENLRSTHTRHSGAHLHAKAKPTSKAR